MKYYNEIKNKLIDSEIYCKIKDYSKERNKVITYFEIGKLLYKAGKIYGEDIIGKYSQKLMIEVGKNYNPRTLRRIRQYYLTFKDEKWSQVATKLSWSHYAELLPIKDKNKMLYYLTVAINLNLSRNDLRNRIKSNEYERLDENTRSKLITNSKYEIKYLVKNPIIIRCNSNYEIISEKILQKLILENISSFLDELGIGFTFIRNEYKIKLGDKYNYIDLLLYNIKFKCYVVVELKITELKKEHIGQIQTYMNYIDKNLKTIDEGKTIGIIIVKKNDKYIMEYCSDDKIISKEYMIV